MDYKISPIGSVWDRGFFSVPVSVAENMLKLSSENQIKALLIVLSKNGAANSDEISKRLGVSKSDVEEFMQFWIDEGVVFSEDSKRSVNPAEAEKPVEEPESSEVKKVASIGVPSLSPKDIVCLCRESEELQMLLNEAQTVLGRTISHAEQEMLINMTNFYGLPVSIVLMILTYYKSEKEKGRAIGVSYITKMAKNWAEEGIATISDAEEKLKSIDCSDRLWEKITGLSGIKHKTPSEKMRKMVESWAEDFSDEMIEIACNEMKEHTEKPNLSYVNGVLKSWKKRGIKTPEDFERDKKLFEQSAQKKEKYNSLKSKPTYDLEQIKRDALNNTEI